MSDSGQSSYCVLVPPSRLWGIWRVYKLNGEAFGSIVSAGVNGICQPIPHARSLFHILSLIRVRNAFCDHAAMLCLAAADGHRFLTLATSKKLHKSTRH